MADEIERKFLVTVLPDSVELGPGEELRQGYLAIDGAVEVRIRISGGAARLTIKAGSGLSRTEVEVPLAPTDADDLWEHTAGRRIEKVRHRVALAPGIDADVDRYRAGLSGLCTAEVEFADLESARAFPPPRWFGREVTGEPGWSNAALARHGIPAAGGDQQD
ncbi:MAG: CYTH domain-containing protein [Acidimicrobiales bacterium]